MKKYNFERLINKYAVTCQLVTMEEGHWEAGEWQEGNQTISTIRGAVIPISQKRMQSSGGSYQLGDCEFITTRDIPLSSDTFLIYKEKKYKLTDTIDYSEYADFKTYLGKGVSAFDTAGNHTENIAP